MTSTFRIGGVRGSDNPEEEDVLYTQFHQDRQLVKEIPQQIKMYLHVYACIESLLWALHYTAAC